MMTTTQNSDLNVLFQDDSLCVIHKPAGIAFHSTDDAMGIVQLVKQHFGETNYYPVHRLDKMTSGLMIFARTPEINADLSKLFAEKKMEKYYLAVSLTKPNKKQGAIVGDMQKGRRGSYLLLRSKNNPSVTRFFARSFSMNNENKRAWFFVLKPETGKTHQLRVALKSLGSGVLGDTRYSQDVAERGYLHAYKIRFELKDKFYEFCDPNFDCDFFKLSDTGTQAELGQYLEPEQLNWPKAAFRVVH